MSEPTDKASVVSVVESALQPPLPRSLPALPPPLLHAERDGSDCEADVTGWGACVAAAPDEACQASLDALRLDKVS